MTLQELVRALFVAIDLPSLELVFALLPHLTEDEIFTAGSSEVCG